MNPSQQRPLSIKSDIGYAYLGEVEYQKAFETQIELVERRKRGLIGDTALMLQHPHTYTLGTRGKDADILLDEAELRARSIALFRSNRGGEATYHGPGQLVVYLILNLRELGIAVVEYVRLLEGVIMDVALEYGIASSCIAGKPGVFVKDNGDARKLAAIGVRVSSGVTMHGFALNVSTDLSYFKHIVPCGMPGMAGASLASEASGSGAAAATMPDVCRLTVASLGRRLGRAFEELAASQIALSR